MVVILIGPMKVGKSTVAKLLAERLGLPRHPLDQNRWGYFAELGYDAEHAQVLAETKGINAAMQYWKPFEVHAVERHLAQHRDCVADFGAGYSVQDEPAFQERIKSALAKHFNVVLLLPSPDVDESIACLEERVEAEFRELNAHYLRSPANRALATAVVYTLGKTPEQTCEDVLGLIRDELQAAESAEGIEGDLGD